MSGRDGDVGLPFLPGTLPIVAINPSPGASGTPPVQVAPDAADSPAPEAQPKAATVAPSPGGVSLASVVDPDIERGGQTLVQRFSSETRGTYILAFVCLFSVGAVATIWATTHALIGSAYAALVGVVAIGATAVYVIGDQLRFLRNVKSGVQLARDVAMSPEQVAALDHLDEMPSDLAEVIRVVARLQSRSRTYAASLRELLTVSREMAAHLTLEHVIRACVGYALRVSRMDTAVMWTVDDNGLAEPIFDSRHPTGMPMDVSNDGLKLVRHVVTIVASAHQKDSWGVPFDGIKSGDIARLALPLTYGGKIVAILELRAEMRARRLHEEEIELLDTLSNQAATAFEAARLHTEAQQKSFTDGLTGLFNRRRFDEDLRLEIARAERYKRPLVLVLFDIDHFKNINDQHGHQAGDEVLRGVGGVLKSGLRTTDTVYRYGGEEFALVLRETPLAAAAQVVERLRQGVATMTVSAPVKVTISAGLAGVPEHGLNPEALIAASDQALYVSKRTGRDRLSIAPMAAPPAVATPGA
jgi:diguanylate cyclase (GGDEF)-like protein